MTTLLALFSRHCYDIIPSDIDDKRMLVKWAAAIVIISSILTVFLGFKALAIIAALIVIIAAFKYEVFLLIFLFFTEEPARILLQNYSTFYLYGITLFIILLWLARKFILPNANIQYSVHLLVFSFFFLIVASLSVLNGPMSKLEMAGFIKLIIFFILLNIIYDIYKPRYTIYIFLAVLIPIFVMSMFLFAKYLQAPNLIAIMMQYRNKGMKFYWTINFNAFAAVIVMVLPFCWAVFLWIKRKWIKYFSGVIALLLTLALLLTAARAALMGFALIIIILLIWAKKTKLLLIPPIVALVIIFLYPGIFKLIAVALRFEAGTTGRSVIWVDMLKIISNNFWFGTGLDSFGAQYLKYFSINQLPDKVIPHDAHNQILDWIVRLGIMGLPLAISVYYLSIKNGIMAAKKAINLEDKAIIIGIFGGLIAICARSTFESGAFLLSEVYLFPAIIYWTFLAMLMKLNTYDKLPEKGLFSIK